MKIRKGILIPFPGFKAVNVFGVIFVRDKHIFLSDRFIRHETIHTKQMKEMWYIPFYLWYFIEWLIKIPFYRFNLKQAYRNISFEREAFRYEYIIDYENNRKRFAWLKMIKI